MAATTSGIRLSLVKVRIIKRAPATPRTYDDYVPLRTVIGPTAQFSYLQKSDRLSQQFSSTGTASSSDSSDSAKGFPP
jgi:hypothetical protein